MSRSVPGAIRSAAAATTSQMAITATVTRAYTSSVARQLWSKAGISTLLAVTNGNTPPMAGAVMVTPMAIGCSSESNHTLISLGAPTDTSGPPRPNTATAPNIPRKLSANGRSSADAEMRMVAMPKERRSPSRSTSAPEGSAEKRNTNGQVPSTTPMTPLLKPRSSRMVSTSGAMENTDSPKEKYTIHSAPSITQRKEWR